MAAFEHRLYSADVKPKGYSAVFEETFATDPFSGTSPEKTVLILDNEGGSLRRGQNFSPSPSLWGHNKSCSISYAKVERLVTWEPKLFETGTSGRYSGSSQMRSFLLCYPFREVLYPHGAPAENRPRQRNNKRSQGKAW